MNNVVIVSNFSAGRKKAVKYKKDIQKFLIKKQVYFRFVDIEQLNNLDMNKFDTVLVVGGDGTINKVLPYLINTDKILGIIPSGTANLLASKLGINSLSKALKTIEKGNSRKIDIMFVNNKPSILRFGLGFDADIIGKTPQSLKNKFGYFAYFIAGIIFALRLNKKEYDVLINNKSMTLNASCLIIANAANMYKNFFSVANNSKLNDGFFDVFILKTQNPLLLFFQIIKIMLNLRHNDSVTEYIKADNVNIKNKYCLAHIDGEKRKYTQDLNFTIQKESLNVFTDKI